MKFKVALFATFFLVASAIFGQESRPLYKDSSYPVNIRVEDLLRRMTLREKIHQMQNVVITDTARIRPRLNGMSYGSTHDMKTPALYCADKYRKMQDYLLNETRLGIPVITTCEGLSGILQDSCTIFPQALAQGSTFNPELIYAMTCAAGIEAKALGISQILSPVLDLARELRWGRVEETFGEDPFLTAEIAKGFVQGYQSHNITCTPKHFMAHGSPTGGLNCANVSGGERELRSLYLYPFKRVIRETSPRCVMTSYSSYDGVANMGSHYYMTEILRDYLGFNGYLYSDWGSVKHLKTFHSAVETLAEAGIMALKAGLDLNIDNCFEYQYIGKMVESGQLDIAHIDRAVRRILQVKFELGLFDEPYDKSIKVADVVHCPEHVRLSEQVAEESAILLKNDKKLLPLDLKKYKSIAVIGPNADQTVFGDYAWPKRDSDYGVTLLDGIKNKMGDCVKINYAPGCDWWSQDRSGFKKAVQVAKRSDVVVVAVGTRSVYLARGPKEVTSGEGFDLSSLELPGVQEDLIRELHACGKPIIVIFISGKPLAMPWVKEHADAVLVQWYGGEKQGDVLANILTGVVNPSGRLNVSFPRSTGNTPCYYNYLPTDRGHFGKGGTLQKPEGHYIFEQPGALWPFGYGLSYTQFKYHDITFNKETFAADETLKVTVDVENTGSREGKELVQLYVRDKISSVATPIRQLKAFKKVLVPAGGCTRVELSVPISELGLFNEKIYYVVEPGDFDIQIGKSSEDIVFSKIIKVE